MFSLQLVYVEGLNFVEIAPFAPKLNLGALTTDDLALRVSFFHSSLDADACPVIYSQEKEVSAVDIRSQVAQTELLWAEPELPNLITAYNTVALCKQMSLLLLLWAKPIKFSSPVPE